MNTLQELKKLSLLCSLLFFMSSGVSAEAQNVKGSQSVVAKGILHSVEDGVVLVETEITAETAQKLSLAGFSMIKSKNEIASQTILGKRLFMGYSIAVTGPKINEIKIRLGKPVTLIMRRSKNKNLVITSMK